MPIGTMLLEYVTIFKAKSPNTFTNVLFISRDRNVISSEILDGWVVPNAYEPFVKFMGERNGIEIAYPECKKAAASAGKSVCDRIFTSLRGRAPRCERRRPLLGNAVCTFAGFLGLLGSLCFVVQDVSSRIWETRTGILQISRSF